MLEFLKNHIWDVLIVLNYALAISAAITILLKNSNPTKTLAYIIVLAILPFFSLVVYYFFGQDYRKDKIFNRKYIYNKKLVKEIDKELQLKPVEVKRLSERLDEKAKLVRLLYNNENAPLTLHNKLKVLKNGEEKFKELIKDLQIAQHHIHLEYYIIRDDKIGTQILDILCDKSTNGVEVRIIYDYVGSSISSSMLRKLKESGVMVESFMPVFFPSFASKMNYRNHRKIVIIDGKIGYLGGINISDNYSNEIESNFKMYWRDTHLRIEGDAVKSLQIQFLMSWDFVSDENLSISKPYLPNFSVRKQTSVQIVASGPDTDWANIKEAVFTAISTAEEYVYITTPYFIPDDEIVSAMQVVAKSGVEVKLLIPKESDSIPSKYASESYLEALLEAGVEVHLYKKGFIHAKTIVVDDIFSTVGTANMDYRSFNINFEINALIYDRSESLILKEQFLDDLKDSEELSLNSWQQRSKVDKLKESFFRLFAPLL